MAAWMLLPSSSSERGVKLQTAVKPSTARRAAANLINVATDARAARPRSSRAANASAPIGRSGSAMCSR